MANNSADANYSPGAPLTRDVALQVIRDSKDVIAHYATGNMMEPLLSMPLTIQQLRVLGLLYVEPEHNTGAQLAERLNISLATVSGLIDRLAALDMVQRQDDPADQRVRRITLTPTGQGLVRDFFESQDRMTDHLMGQLSDADLTALATGVQALANVLQQYSQCS